MFLCIHTNKIHTDIKHTTEQIKKTSMLYLNLLQEMRSCH